MQMTKRILLALALSTLSAPPLTAQPTTASGADAPDAKEDLVPVALETGMGRIVIALDRAHAPITTANFLHYVDTHRYDGQTIYRAMTSGSGGLIQGGITTDARKLFAPIV